MPPSVWDLIINTGDQKTRPPTEAAPTVRPWVQIRGLLRQALDSEGTEFRVLVADLPVFLELR